MSIVHSQRSPPLRLNRRQSKNYKDLFVFSKIHYFESGFLQDLQIYAARNKEKFDKTKFDVKKCEKGVTSTRVNRACNSLE